MFTVKRIKQYFIQFPLWKISISALIVGIDRLTKILAESYLNPHQPIPILPSFDFVLMYNTGAAFSLLHNAGGWQRYFFIAITLFVLIILWRWLSSLEAKNTILSAGLALIIGGAIGNLIDRFITGAVVDFISIYYLTWRWPAFNIADAAISIGVSLLLIDAILINPKTN